MKLREDQYIWHTVSKRSGVRNKIRRKAGPKQCRALNARWRVMEEEKSRMSFWHPT